MHKESHYFDAIPKCESPKKTKKTFWKRGIGQMVSERKGTWWATMSRPRRSFVLKFVKAGPRERSRSPQNSLLL
jgi:hypothetical protein